MDTKEKKAANTATATKAKKPAKRAAKTTKSTKQAHVPTPWLKLKQLWESGASYEAMAKATDAHFDPNKADPTKPTRAKIWKARNVGVTIDGKLVKFGARGKAKEGAKKGKPTKVVKKAAVKGKATKKAAKARVEGKAETSSSMETATKATSV
jgi:hypothetical protein